jgi:hypothetical protein
MHLVSNGMASFPMDIWYPATLNLQPQTSDQYSAGFSIRLFRKFQLTDNHFYKQMHHVVEYAEGADIFYQQDFEDEMVSGRGWSYGNEFSIAKKSGRLTGSLSYTLSWALRQFAEKNFGNPYYANFDRRHYLSLNAAYDINKRWSVDAGWIFASGNPITLPIARFWLSYLSTFEVLYEEKNNYRLPPFHHLDIAIKYQLHSKKDKSLSFGFYNIYDRKNIYYVHFKKVREPGKPEYYIVHKVSILPIIPFFSFNFTL